LLAKGAGSSENGTSLKIRAVYLSTTNLKGPLAGSLVAAIIIASFFGYYYVQSSAAIASRNSAISSLNASASGELSSANSVISNLTSLLDLRVMHLLLSNRQYVITADSAERVLSYNATVAGYLQISGVSNETNSYAVVCEQQSYCGFTNGTEPVTVSNFGTTASFVAPFVPGTVYVFLEAGTYNTTFTAVTITSFT
jgi:hypothetical protein